LLSFAWRGANCCRGRDQLGPLVALEFRGEFVVWDPPSQWSRSGYQGGRISEGQLMEIKEEPDRTGEIWPLWRGGRITEVVVDRGSTVHTGSTRWPWHGTDNWTFCDWVTWLMALQKVWNCWKTSLIVYSTTHSNCQVHM
jgi:hypothetical protein